MQLKEIHEDYYRSIETDKTFQRGQTQSKMENAKLSQAQNRMNNVLRIVAGIQEEEILRNNLEQEQVRQYICNTLTPVISEGLVKIVEIKPRDPVDYLVNFL